MKLNKIKLIIGFVLVLVPVLGFPRWFKSTVSIFVGSVVIVHSIIESNKDSKRKHKKNTINSRHDSFVESKPHNNFHEPKKDSQNISTEPALDLRKEETIKTDTNITEGPHLADAEKEQI